MRTKIELNCFESERKGKILHDAIAGLDQFIFIRCNYFVVIEYILLISIISAFLLIGYFVPKAQKRQLNEIGTKIFGAGNFRVLSIGPWRTNQSDLLIGSVDDVEFMVSETYGARPKGPPPHSTYSIAVPNLGGPSILKKRWLNRPIYSSPWPSTLEEKFGAAFWLYLPDHNDAGEFLKQAETCGALEQLEKIDSFQSLSYGRLFDGVKDAELKWDKMLSLTLRGSLKDHDKHEVVDVVFNILRTFAKVKVAS